MTDIKQLKAELAQAKKDLKAEEKRTKAAMQLIRALTERLNDCEDIFSLVLALDEDHRGEYTVDIPTRDMKSLVREINTAWNRNTKALGKKASFIYANEI